MSRTKIFQNLPICGGASIADVVGRKVKLVHRPVANPIRGPLCVSRHDLLPSEDRPTLVATDAIPISQTCFEERIPGLNGFSHRPNSKRRTRSTARLVADHASPIAIIRKECLWMGPKG